ncbi:MAG: hypothetical protein AAF371_12775 [Pseudomonadota bacterium]
MRWIGVLFILCAVAFCVALLTRMPVPDELEAGIKDTARALAEATAERDPGALPPAPSPADGDITAGNPVGTVETDALAATGPVATAAPAEDTTDAPADDAAIETGGDASPEAAADDGAAAEGESPVDRVVDYVIAIGRAAGLIDAEDPAGTPADDGVTDGGTAVE